MVMASKGPVWSRWLQSMGPRHTGLKQTLILINTVFSLVIVAVLVVVYWMTQTMAQDSDTINLTGRQRMLSQKMVKEFLLYSGDRQPAGLAALQVSVQVFDETLTALLTGGMAPRTLDRNRPDPVQMSRPTAATEVQLQRAQAIWKPLMARLQRLGQDDSIDLTALRQELLPASDQLLQAMHQASAGMTQVASDHVARIVQAVVVSGVIALLVTGFVLLRIRAINQQLDRFHHGMGAIAGGQLTHRITEMDRTTELGRLAYHANQLADSFVNISRHVMMEARSLGASVQEIIDAKNHLAQDSHDNQ
ncbi:MAG: methyl-accepting chemotaxis protein, partial [Magnetococcales bacterium]|nr:methyl-accepting chemotaxis protein [Magnetococcales bacterium]